MTKVLVTGCAGFIGANLCQVLLRAGHHVVGIDDLSAGMAANVPEGVAFHRLDIRDESAHLLFKGVDTVFHLAARNCISDCIRWPRETCSINVEGTSVVLEACREMGVRKIVYAGSSAVYEGVSSFPTTEDQVGPQETYSVSKYAGELLCQAYKDMFGLTYTILRYFNVYGPGQDIRRTVPPVISAFAMKLLAGEAPRIYGDGSKRRDFVHVDDVNAFHVLTLSDPRTDCGTFNVGSGENHSVLEVYEAVAEAVGKRLAVQHEPELAGEAQITLADIRRGGRLGWRPSVSFAAGVRGTVEHLSAALTA